MDQLKLLNAAERGDEYYREHWSLYYAERRRLLHRVFRLAGALGVLFTLCSWALEKCPPLGYVLAVPTSILLLALPAQWFIFVWRMRTWTCPRCGEYFFTSTLVNNPFGRHCRHCRLVRPKESEPHAPGEWPSVLQ